MTHHAELHESYELSLEILAFARNSYSRSADVAVALALAASAAASLAGARAHGTVEGMLMSTEKAAKVVAVMGVDIASGRANEFFTAAAKCLGVDVEITEPPVEAKA